MTRRISNKPFTLLAGGNLVNFFEDEMSATAKGVQMNAKRQEMGLDRLSMKIVYEGPNGAISTISEW